MKTILMSALLIFSSVSWATNDSYLQTIIRAHGYQCNTMDSIHVFMNQNGYHVFCDNFKYHYEVKDAGGYWVVTPIVVTPK